jgi:RecA-family ATPase
MAYNYIEVETFTKNTTLDQEPPPFLIDGVLHRSVTLLYGQTKSGKSTLAASMAVALAGGHGDWLGRPIAPDGTQGPGKVV